MAVAVARKLHLSRHEIDMRRNWGVVRSRLAREQGLLILLVVAYVVTGRLGLTLAYVHPATSLVWPPSGIALGAFIVLGYRVWPAIFAGAVALYATVLGPVPAILALGAGNTLEALFASYLINRYAGGRNALQTPGNSMRFAGIATVAAAIVSPTIGASALALSKLAPWTAYDSIWLNWSLGSVTGSLLVAPLVILLSHRGHAPWRRTELLEAAVLFAGLMLVGIVTFSELPVPFPMEFLFLPVLLLTGSRLGRLPAAVAVLALTGLALYGTLSELGPFVYSTPTASLVMVMAFMGITAVISLSFAALVAEYMVAEEQLRELVVTDPLTGLPNYRRLIDTLALEISNSNRTGQPFAVVFFDMDALKRINDELGHLAGSRALCRVAETLKASCRTGDLTARFGGDEFVAVMPDTNDEGARAVIHRVTETLADDPDKPELSVSAGIAVYPRDGGTPTTLLSAADRALYAVKADKANARRRGVVQIREWSNAG
jgi:diguanylate cyclase (GGDEF)-like protein